jgi:hypothetical protein
MCPQNDRWQQLMLLNSNEVAYITYIQHADLLVYSLLLQHHTVK